MKVTISKSIDVSKYNIDDYYGFIYKTTNLINGKMYIGQCSFGRINGWKNYLGSGTYFKRALKKYGCENFKRDIIYLAKTVEILDAVEIACIKHFNAVESDMYYNIKETAKGGDTFSTNPNKEKTRALYRKIRSGKGNSQYGKPKTEKMINSVKEANSKKISVNGKVYDSATMFAKESGLPMSTVCYRLKSNSEKWSSYMYIGKNGEPIEKEIVKPTRAKKKSYSYPIIIDGNKYSSINEFHKITGIQRREIKNRLESNEYPNYQYAIQ